MTHAGPPSPRQFLGVMVSSTFEDFRQHREALIGAISGQGLHPIAMEHDSALPAGTVIDSSLQKVRDDDLPHPRGEPDYRLVVGDGAVLGHICEHLVRPGRLEPGWVYPVGRC